MRVDIDSPRPGRVLMTADAVGGVWTYAIDLARELVSRGVAVDLAVMGPPPSTAQRAEARNAGAIVLHAPFRLEWMDDAWADVDAASSWLLELEGALQPDVVHLNGFCHGALPWRAPLIVVAHSCVRSWWRAVKEEEAPARYREYQARVAAGLRAAALVIAPTDAMLRELHADYGPLPAGRVIANGRTFVPLPAATREPFVFACGRLWDEAKNIAALCAAARRISWPVRIAGETEYAGSSCQVPAHVQHLGRVDGEALRGWYGRASIYALPARYEPFGLSVLEAALSGCALVLGDIPSLRETWEGAALFVPPRDEAAIAAAIQSLIDDDRGRLRMGTIARARAADLTSTRMADAYLAAYSETRVAA